MMDKGEFVKGELQIIPAGNGGYLIHAIGLEGRAPYTRSELAAFSSYQDMLNFLREEYEACHSRADGPQPAAEP